MFLEYKASICVIANSQDMLSVVVSILQSQGLHPHESWQENTIYPQTKDGKWYYTRFRVDCKSIPSADPFLWKPTIEKCGRYLQKDGAVIANVTDENLAKYKGNEINENEIIATTPKGKVLNYDTNIMLDLADDIDVDWLAIPHGFDRFEKAFRKVYGVAGKEMLAVYSGKI